jgi:hypothetical protein
MGDIQTPEVVLELLRREMYQLAEDLDILTPHMQVDATVSKTAGLVRRKFIVACERFAAALSRGEAS